MIILCFHCQIFYVNYFNKLSGINRYLRIIFNISTIISCHFFQWSHEIFDNTDIEALISSKCFYFSPNGYVPYLVLTALTPLLNCTVVN